MDNPIQPRTPLTKQQVFDNALFGVRGQDYRQSVNGAACAYRGRDGLKCGIGHSIPDELYVDDLDDTKDKMNGIEPLCERSEFVWLRELLGGDTQFLAEVQAAHDGMRSPDDFEDRMQQIAAYYGLTYTPREASHAA
ncbi:hypothetical protein [Ralstonia sp.]|uniref:hypothetical protein n=1 Tax=Ralstonia sp. TaxID=54061 RepID=UPI00257C1AF2|nr:hypothetical protein [Ralstonia sp.]MBA4282132.1 hypothetical protein [Ralstonia sp.]